MSGASMQACFGLKASAEIIRAFISAMDQIVLWQNMQRGVDALNRSRNCYSKLTASLVGDITIAVHNGHDEYNKATNEVYHWSLLIIPLLNGLLRFLHGNSVDFNKAKKLIILKVLHQGTRHLNAAKNSLEASSVYLNDAAGKLVKLQTQLRHDSENDSAYFQTFVEITQVVQELIVFIRDTCQLSFELKNGISTTEKLIQTDHQHTESAMTEQSKVWIHGNLDNIVQELTKACNDLIDLCSTYTRRHNCS